MYSVDCTVVHVSDMCNEIFITQYGRICSETCVVVLIDLLNYLELFFYVFHSPKISNRYNFFVVS